MSENTNETLHLTVMKNSPHIWAGGLDGKDLALWLIGKANAILSLVTHEEKLNAARSDVVNLELTGSLVKAYAGLGLSLKECDPIRPLSTEAIQFEMALADVLQRSGSTGHSQVAQMLPVGYSQLPDLLEAQEEYQKMKEHLFSQESSECE